jgi:YegS/Rv2252/BmrU family lipid kinase
MASDLGTHFGPFGVEFTTYAGHGRELAREAAAKGGKLIIACGGDGTVNEVANGIIESGTDAEMGILPSGTGGDLRRSLKIPQDTRSAVRALRDGITRQIDAGRVTYLDTDGNEASRYFLNVSSFGLAAGVIRRVKSNSLVEWLPFDALRGRANFAISTLRELTDLEAVAVRVKIDEREEQTIRTVNFCVANARYFGGGMMIAPNAKLNDGMLDVINIGDMSALKVVANAPSVYRGSHLDLDEVADTLAKRIEARPAEDGARIQIEIDGELPGTLPAVFEVVPSAIKVRVPRQ